MRTHPEKSATFPNLCLLQVLRRVSVSCQNDNTKEQQGNATVSKTDRMEKNEPYDSSRRGYMFFWCFEDKEVEHRKSKIADYVKKISLES